MIAPAATPTPPRQVILLLAPPGCGLQLVAGALDALGAALPAGASTLVAARAERLLAEAGRTWCDPKPVPPGRIDPRKQPALVAETAALLDKAFGTAPLGLLAHPGLARTLPVWLDACRRAGVVPLPLLLARSPLAAAAELATEHGLDAEHAQLLWLAHMVTAEAASRPHRRAVLHYDAFRANWRAVLIEALYGLGVEGLAVAKEKAEAVDALLAAAPAAAEPGTDDLLADPTLSVLVKDLHCDLRQARAARQDLDRDQWNRARDHIQDAWLILSPGQGPSRFPTPQRPSVETNAVRVPAGQGEVKPALPALVTTEVPAASLRHVILHYHLFKNAGTSLDRALRAHFKEAWHEREGAGAGWRSADIGAFISDHPEFRVLSTHTGLFPVPVVPGVTVHPLIFLRHPLDRVRSIYDFESKQVADTEGARVARNTDLKGYVAWRVLRTGDRSIRDFQTYRLAMALPPTEGNESERARVALEQLPHVGVVECFDVSLAGFEAALAPIFPGLVLKPTKANVTQRADQTLEDRLANLRRELGDALYLQLEDANQADLALHRIAMGRYRGPGTREGT